jgi:hypothetical protein
MSISSRYALSCCESDRDHKSRRASVQPDHPEAALVAFEGSRSGLATLISSQRARMQPDQAIRRSDIPASDIPTFDFVGQALHMLLNAFEMRVYR